MAECAGQVVGVAVVREAMELEYLRAHYDIERFLYFEHHRAYEHARLLHFALNPVFQHFTRPFLKACFCLTSVPLNTTQHNITSDPHCDVTAHYTTLYYSTLTFNDSNCVYDSASFRRCCASDTRRRCITASIRRVLLSRHAVRFVTVHSIHTLYKYL